MACACSDFAIEPHADPTPRLLPALLPALPPSLLHLIADLAVYYVGLTLQRLASASAECRMHLSTTGLPRVVVPQLLTANLRVRGVFLRLLEQIYGSPHIG